MTQLSCHTRTRTLSRTTLGRKVTSSATALRTGRWTVMRLTSATRARARMSATPPF